MPPAGGRKARAQARASISGAAGFGQGAGFSFTDIMDAFFGGQGGPQGGGRGPRPRERRGQDALIRSVLTGSSNALVAMGYVQASDIEPVIGALLTLGSVAWSVADKRVR